MSRDDVLLLGSGFIGTTLANQLSAQGRHVHLIDRKPPLRITSEVTVHIGDLGNSDLLKKLLPKCSTVVHLASLSTPGSSAGHPARELENLAPTLQLLEILRTKNLEYHLIYLSSGGTVYGNPEQSPVTENARLAPLSYHGAGKVAAESFLQTLRSDGHAVTILRPSNAYGSGQALTQGFGLVRAVLQHIRQGTALEIWGDGENVRDFVYIDDLVDAIVLAINAPNDSSTYNVGSGIGHTLNQVAALAQQICATPLTINYRPARDGDVRSVVLDITRIASTLGWRPRIELKDGIRRTWEWLQKNA